MAKKTNTAEVELRVAKVARMLIEGQSRQGIIQLGDDEWGVSDRTIDEYLSRAYDKISEHADNIIQNASDVSASRLNDLYKKNYEIGDYKECRLVQSTIIDMIEKGLLKEKEPGETKLRSVKNF